MTESAYRHARRHRRVRMNIAVAVTTPAGALAARMVDISEGGACLQLPPPAAPAGAVLTLRFRLPGGPAEHTVQAVVRWAGPPSATTGATTLGVQFERVDMGTLMEIADCVSAQDPTVFES